MEALQALKLISATLVFIFFGLWGEISYLGNVYGDNSNFSEAIAASPSPMPIPTIVPGIPVSVLIPKINVSANIESVGLEKTGRMDVPKNDIDVGWYSLGFKPAEMGSAVFAGHLDTVRGTPAVFWDLHLLEIGDEIYVTDEKNQSFKFIVFDKKSYIYNQVPLDQIFESVGEPTLNLITCGGTFDQAARNYTKRTIVFAKQSNI